MFESTHLSQALHAFGQIAFIPAFFLQRDLVALVLTHLQSFHVCLPLSSILNLTEESLHSDDVSSFESSSVSSSVGTATGAATGVATGESLHHDGGLFDPSQIVDLIQSYYYKKR
jgi:hypothetical protein